MAPPWIQSMVVSACGDENSFCTIASFIVAPMNVLVLLFIPYFLAKLNVKSAMRDETARGISVKVLLVQVIVCATQALFPAVLLEAVAGDSEIMIDVGVGGLIFWAISSFIAWGACFVLMFKYGERRQVLPSGLLVWWIGLFIAQVAMAITVAGDTYSSAGALRRFEELIVINAVVLLALAVVACVGLNGKGVGAHATLEALNALSPVEKAPLLSRITFWWMNPILTTGYKRPLDLEDLPKLPKEDTSDHIAELFMRNYMKTVKKGKPSFAWALITSFSPLFLSAMVMKLVHDMLIFVGPAMLNAIVKYLQDTNFETHSRADGLVYVGILFVAANLTTVLIQQYFFKMTRMGLRVRSAVVLAVYRKSLKLSVGARQGTSMGKIVNIMSTDAQRMQALTTYLQMIWSGPFQITLSLYFLWQQVGVATLAGLTVMILFVPVNGFIARQLKKQQNKLMGAKDERVNLTNETLAGILFIKLSAWENEFRERIGLQRKKELVQLRNYMLVNQLSVLMWRGLPLLVSLTTFSVYVMLGNSLTASRIFTALSLFNILGFPMSMLPNVINNLVEASVSVNRINRYLAAEEVDPSACRRLPASAPVDVAAVEVKLDESSGAGAGAGVGEGTVATGPAIEVRGGEFLWPLPKASLVLENPPKRGFCFGLFDRCKKSNNHARLLEDDGAADAAAEPDPEAGTASPEGKGRLTGINLAIQPGELVAVVGHVAAGKTSLLNAILGEMEKVAGDVSVRGSVAYVSQTAFIMNATLRDNILFGQEFNNSQYTDTINVCSMQSDLDMLPGRDQTEIGERGINLSGGQRQRVSIARAVYSDSDVYLFDDPLSAVDAHVGHHIFQKCILQKLAGKTRVLVTHGIQYMAQCDRVIVMRDGAVAECGTFRELADNEGSILAGLVRTHDEEAKRVVDDALAGDDQGDAEGEGETAVMRRRASSAASAERERTMSAQSADKDKEDKLKAAGKLVDKEGRAKGSVSLRVYKNYMDALGGVPAAIGVLGMFMVYQSLKIGSDWYLSSWSEATTEDTPLETNMSYLGGYAAIVGISLFIYAIQRVLVAFTSVRASRVLHEGLLQNVLQLPMSFFDTTPLGRILNRFSQDIYNIDEVIPRTLGWVYGTFFATLSTLIVVIAVTPTFLLAIIPLAMIYYFSQRYYVATVREVKRLESTSKSPIYAHFSETLGGTVTIRAFSEQQRFRTSNRDKLDYNQRTYFSLTSTQRWLAVRLEFLGTGIVVGTTLSAVLAHGSLSSALAGLSISYALSVTNGLNWMVRQTGELQAQIVAVERVKEYSTIEPEPTAGVKPARDWPAAGAIDISNLQVKYRPHLPYVLNKVNASIKAGEKIGICGRTGAGKSSLISALFRLADVQEGSVKIDGVEIGGVPLRDLRSRIAIIPQAATLYSGTLRHNLDPLGKWEDEQLSAVLNMVSLSEFSSKLDTKVAEGGENWSHGQRQLICMARACLKKCRVVILDEATAAMDVETDAAIQRIISDVFSDCTVLTIAHRVHTIVNSDRIMVLDKGRVVEFDSPATLRANPDSHFSSLLRQSASANHQTD